jgi:hypothetical protein
MNIEYSPEIRKMLEEEERRNRKSKQPKKMGRRSFLKIGAGAVAAGILGYGVLSKENTEKTAFKAGSKEPAEKVEAERNIQNQNIGEAEGESGFEEPDFIQSAPPASETAKLVGESIFAQIKEARDAIRTQKMPDFFYIEDHDKRGGIKKEKHRTDALLAILDIKSGEKKFVAMDEKGESQDKGYLIAKGYPSGMGTEYLINNPPNCVVLAVKKVKHKAELVYTPYSKTLDCPAARKKGFEYLVNNLQRAKEDLEKGRVRSSAFQGKLVCNSVPGRMALALSVVEQIDPNAFKRMSHENQKKFPHLNVEEADSEAVKVLANKVFTTIGLNLERSYRYAVSGKGARGLFQFMPKTYRSMVKNYPNARLNPDFFAGTNDHLNAAKASLLLFDSDLSCIPEKSRKELPKFPEIMGKVLASSYNAGFTKTFRAILKHREKYVSFLSDETKDYDRKFAALSRAMGRFV